LNLDEDVKLLGVYSSEQMAAEAKERAIGLPGFRDAPDGFDIDCYRVDRDEWTEGFITVTAGE
jgi:hypothetical protein